MATPFEYFHISCLIWESFHFNRHPHPATARTPPLVFHHHYNHQRMRTRGPTLNDWNIHLNRFRSVKRTDSRSHTKNAENHSRAPFEVQCHVLCISPLPLLLSLAHNAISARNHPHRPKGAKHSQQHSLYVDEWKSHNLLLLMRLLLLLALLSVFVLLRRTHNRISYNRIMWVLAALAEQLIPSDHRPINMYGFGWCRRQCRIADRLIELNSQIFWPDRCDSAWAERKVDL